MLTGTFLDGVSQGDVSATPINEASGLAASQLSTNVLWTHNDAGDTNRIFAINGQGVFLGSFTLAGATNVDYEDIAIGKGPVPGTSYIYVGDIGDNAETRTNIKLYRTAEPVVSATGGDQSATLTSVDIITLNYPDGAHNAETLLLDPLSGDLTIVTKHTTNVNRVYQAAAPGPGDQTINLEFKGVMSWATALGGDVSSSGLEILIKNTGTVYLGRCKVVIAGYFDRPVFVYALTSANAACRCD